MKNILVLAVSACAVCAFGAATKDFYVSTNGLHEVGGVIWGTYVTEDGVAHNAYTNLQEAIKANGKSGNTIWVEDGFVCDVGGETADGTGSRITTPYIDGVDKFIIRINNTILQHTFWSCNHKAVVDFRILRTKLCLADLSKRASHFDT